MTKSNEEVSWQPTGATGVLYEWDIGMHRQAQGLRLLPRLTEDQTTLIPRLRMRINLAVEVVLCFVFCLF